MSIVRRNLMERPGYTPYCGSENCRLGMPRTHFNGKQFACGCGWQSGFEPEFISEYVKRQHDLVQPIIPPTPPAFMKL